MRVADYVMNFIYQNLQVDTIFMVSGGGIMHLTDALICHEHLHYVCSHNEQATSMEADGYAKIRGSFGVALVTTGPGATNAITGVVGAWQDSTPVMVISGQSKRQQTIHLSGLKGLRQFGVQEANILPMIESVTKYAAMIDDPSAVRYHLEKAAFLGRHGRPGPVWLDIPLDIQSAIINPQQLSGFDPITEGFTEEYLPSDDLVKDIAELFADAERPLIVAGAGVRIAGATSLLRDLAEQINVPIVTPRLGIDLIATDHPLYVGRPGIKGDRAGNFAIQNADLLLCIGTRLCINVTGHEYEKFARSAKIIVVDKDKVEHQKPTINIDRFIQCDAKVFLRALARISEKNELTKKSAWPECCRDWKKRYPVVLPEYALQKEPINTYQFTKILSECMNPEDVIVIDSGSSSYVVSQSIAIKKGQRYVASGGLGSMGYAVPAALGASIAGNKGRVVAVTGDGSLHMNAQELSTIAHENLPVKIFVFDNRGYASIKATQHNYFNDRYIGVDRKSGVALPDILKLAELYSIEAFRIANTDDLNPIIKEALEYDGPVLVDIICSPDQLIIPTVFSKKREDGSMVSLPIEDMFPFLDRDEFKKQMIVQPLPESL